MKAQALPPIDRGLATLALLVAAALRLWALEALPPGVWYDEAANLIDARFVLAGERPIFFEGNQGREPLFIYLVAATQAVIGPQPLALRLPAVAAGLLSVALLSPLARRLLGPPAALPALAVGAVTLWAVSLSRLGLRAGLLPLLAAFTLYWLERARQEGRPLLALPAGLGLGLSLYTYLAARALPAVVLAYGLLTLACWPGPGGRWRWGLSLGLVFTGAALVGLPLALYARAHPHLFFERAQNLGGLGRLETLTPMDLVAPAVALLLAGDPQPRHNLPGRGVFDPLLGTFFVAGGLLLLRRWRTPATALLALWTGGLLGPMVLAGEGPHFLRASGALPALLLIPAAALGALRDARPRLGLAMVLLVLGLSGGWTAHDYFGRWAHDPRTEWHFEAAGQRAARLALASAGTVPVYLSTPFYRDQPTYLVGQPALADRLTAFDGQRALVLPPPGAAALYLFPDVRQPDPPLLERLFPRRQVSAGVTIVQYLSDGASPAPARQLAAWFGPWVEFLGYDLPTVVRAGERFRVTLYWRIHRPAPGRLTQFVHLLEVDQVRPLALDDYTPFPTAQWRPGLTVITWFDLTVPPGTPTAARWLITGFYDPATLQRLPVRDPQGQPAGDRLRLGPVKVLSDRPESTPSPSVRTRIAVAPGTALIGYDLDRRIVQPGERLAVTLYWQAGGPLDRDYTVFVHLAEPTGRVRAQSDSQPDGGHNPTSLWLAGEVIRDQHTLLLPADLPPGRYRLLTGLYDLTSGQRHPLWQDGRRLPDDQALLTEIIVEDHQPHGP